MNLHLGIFVFGLCISVARFPVIFGESLPRPNATTRIIGGGESHRGEFPFLVRIALDGNQYCGGSIVNNYWILTAAHCSPEGTDETRFTVIAGEHDTRVNEGYEQIRNVSRIVAHPLYDSGTFANDIAVWKVSFPFEFNRYVQPGKLAGAWNIFNFFGTLFLRNVVAAGWGTVVFKGDHSPVLQKVTLPVIPIATCRSRLKGTELEASSKNNGIICAGGNKGKDTCHGDSGGPILRLKTVVGLVSAGLDCDAGYPSIYTDVAYHSTWILFQIFF